MPRMVTDKMILPKNTDDNSSIKNIYTTSLKMKLRQ